MINYTIMRKVMREVMINSVAVLNLGTMILRCEDIIQIIRDNLRQITINGIFQTHKQDTQGYANPDNGVHNFQGHGSVNNGVHNF